MSDAQFVLYFGRSPGMFVEFRSPDCAHCDKLKPIFDQVGAAFADSALVVGLLDGKGAARQAAQQLGVNKYPTILWIGANKEGTRYKGANNFDSFLSFMLQQSSGAAAAAAEARAAAPAEPEAGADCADLDAEGLAALAANRGAHRSLLIYGGSQTCDAMTKTYAQLGAAFRREPGVVVAMVNGRRHEDALRALGALPQVPSFPHVRHFARGTTRAPVEYSLEPTRALKFLLYQNNKEAATLRAAGGEYNALAGTRRSLDILASQFEVMMRVGEAKLAAKVKARAVADVAKLVGAAADDGGYYLKVMERMEGEGGAWAEKESVRIVALETPTTSAAASDAMKKRLNVLRKFFNAHGEHEMPEEAGTVFQKNAA